MSTFMLIFSCTEALKETEVAYFNTYHIGVKGEV